MLPSQVAYSGQQVGLKHPLLAPMRQVFLQQVEREVGRSPFVTQARVSLNLFISEMLRY
ncbi:MAG: hypothetical protein GDA56_23310 [Hormoscilla sp. GM7CHS1pb]|nr:hypothetical protein [Hormoscilla sp. GM7CHS1pb]